MYHPTTRVLTVLELLQSHRQISGTELAVRLEVDKRTIRRYIMMLQDMGIPVEAETGRFGGYTLRPGFKLPPLMFTDDEALALTLSLMAGQQLGLAASAPAIEGALTKVERVLPSAMRERVLALRKALVLDVNAPNVYVAMKILSALSLAVHHHRQTDIVYQAKADDITERIIDPYGIVAYEGRWYVAGYCHLREAIRVFRLDRIQSVDMRERTFAPPADFDSFSYVLDSFASIPDRWDIEVLLLTTLEAARPRIPRELATLEQTPDGLLMRTSMPDLEWMARFLVGLGCPLVVHHPSELQTALQKLALEIMQIARTPASEDKVDRDSEQFSETAP